jgi:hypothetical protein
MGEQREKNMRKTVWEVEERREMAVKKVPLQGLRQKKRSYRLSLGGTSYVISQHI